MVELRVMGVKILFQYLRAFSKESETRNEQKM